MNTENRPRYIGFSVDNIRAATSNISHEPETLPQQRDSLNPVYKQDKDRLKLMHAIAMEDLATEEERQIVEKNPVYRRLREQGETGVLGVDLMAGLVGIEHAYDPSIYWTGQKLEMPEFGTKSEAYRLLYEDFRSKARATRQTQIDQQKALDKVKDSLTPLIDTAITIGNAKPSIEQLNMLKKAGVTWNSITRARNAYQVSKAYHKATSLYDEDSIQQIHQALENDPTAKKLLLNYFGNDRKSIYKNYINPQHDNAIERGIEGSFKPILNFLREGTLKAKRSIDNSLNQLQQAQQLDPELAEQAIRFSAQRNKQADAENKIKQYQADTKQQRELESLAAELITTGERAEATYNKENNTPWYNELGTTLGGITGDTAAFVAGGAYGKVIAASNLIQRRQNEGLALGIDYDEAKKRGRLLGAIDTAVEFLGYHTLGKAALGATGINKLIAGSKALNILQGAKLSYLKSTTARMGVSTIDGIIEEGIIEPSAQYALGALASQALTDERGKVTLESYLDDLKQFGDPIQLAALIIFSGGMTGAAFPKVKQDVLDFTNNLQNFKSIGGTEAGFLQASKITDETKRAQYIASHIKEQFTLHTSETIERAKTASSNLPSAEEVNAIRNMEAFTALQNIGALPKFEKNEQENTYKVHEANPTIKQTTNPDTPQTPRLNTTMTADELTSYLQITLTEELRSAIISTQNILAGNLAVEDFAANGGTVEDIGNTETMTSLRSLALHASSAVRALEATGLTRAQALQSIDPKVSPTLPLISAINLYSSAKTRLSTAKKRGEASSFASNAYVTRIQDQYGHTRKILRYAKGRASVFDLWEETMEQAAISYATEHGINLTSFGALLQEAQRNINENYKGAEAAQFIKLDITPTYHDVVEAFSLLGKSRLMLDSSTTKTLPSWIQKLIDYIAKFIPQFQSTLALGEKLRNMEADGKLTPPIQQMITRMLSSVEDIYKAHAHADIAAMEESYIARAQTQAHLDALLGQGIAIEPESIEENLNAIKQEDQTITTTKENNPTPTAEKATATQQRQEQYIATLGETDDTGIFTNNLSLPVAEGIRSGYIAKSKLTLSKDVEQFKQGADKNGIARKLVGAWQPDTAPISVWKRKNGSLEVISGRHRFAHCPTEDIACHLYEENDSHDLAWAKQHDVEHNIRDGQATAYEIARYTKETSLTMAEATERGIAREGNNLKGIQLGIHSTTETLAALKNNLITEDDAYRTATAFPSNIEAQRSATAALIDGSSWSEAYNTATAKLAIQALAASNASNGYQQDIDLFGNTDTEALYRHIGHYATKRQAELGKEITAINGAAKNPSIAQKYGIDVQNPESTRQAITKLQEIRSQWKNFALHPELLQEANNYAKTKLSKTNAKESIAASRQIDETLLNNINTQTTFSITPQDNSQWNKQLDDYFSSKKINPLNHLTIGGTPAILTALGYEKRNIVISPGTLNKIMVDKHNLTENEVRDLARAIYDPILIIDSASESDALIVLTDIKNERGSIIAAIHIDKKMTGGIYHKVASAYTKESGHMILSQIKNGHLRYIDKKRALAWARSFRLQLPNTSSQKGKPIVLTPEDIVKQKNTHDKNSTTFSIIGSNATNFLEYKDQGLSYLDPADHKEKAIISTEGISLRKQKLTIPQGSVTHTSLAALLHHPELYRSYPDIAKYRVSIYNDPEENASGFMSKDSAYIAINTAYGDSTSQLSTLLHEIQHAIQLHEGFATGSAVTTKKEAIAYIKHSIQQLNNRADEWAKHQLPFLRTLHNQVQKNKIDPQSIYLASHGEQEARLAGKLTTKTKGGKNGYKLLGIGGNLTIPITGEWKDLGAITFTKSPYSTLLADKLAPQGDWIYDTLIFKIRASLDRTAKRLSNYTTNQQDTNNEGLELYAQAIELITSVEKYLPKSYGMALEPYKIWINTFATLAGNGNINEAANTLPMKHWDDIMTKSFTKAYHNYIANNPAILIAQETLKAQDPENADAILFHTYGQNFLKQYGKEKIDKLIAKFLDRTIEHIDQYRKDKTLGKIRRITSTLTPKHDKNGKPLKGKITADQYRKLESYIRLIELTESEYNNYFEEHYNDNTPEEQRYENLPPEHPITLTLEDDDGTSKQHIYTKQEFETYACWTLMNVNTAERAAAALGEYISTSRNAWENAQLNKKAQTETLLQDLLTSTGDITETQIAQARNKSKLTPLPKETLSILDVFMNLGQYADILSKHPELKSIANNLKQRAAKASTNIEYAELQRLQAQQQIIANITGITDRYQQSDWLYEHKRTRDSGITITTQEPDYQAKANAEYQDRLLKLLRRKAKTHGLETLQPYLQALDLSPTTQAIVHARYTHPSIKPTKKQITKALEHQDRVFTPSEWNTYASQTKFIKEKSAQLKEKAKENTPSTQTLNAISRDAAAYIILLCEQKSYTEMMRQKGYTEEVIDKLHEFVGAEGMRYAYALRELLNTRSKEIQQLVEKRYGTPFPLEDNYYRAYFDASPELTNKSIADGSSYGDAANAGTYGSIHTRRKHNAPIDLSIGASSAFMAATAEQDILIHCSEISRDLRAILNYKKGNSSAARSLEYLLGAGSAEKLSLWADILDKTGIEHIRGHIDQNKLFSRLSAASAQVLLSWRLGTLTKQTTALINTLFADDNIGLKDFLTSLNHIIAGTAKISVADILSMPELASRDKTQYSTLKAALNAPADKATSRLEAFARKGMDNIERLDVLNNAIAAAIHYDASYRRYETENPKASPEEHHEAAMQSVRESLELKAQPINHRQKSLMAQNKLWLLLGPLYLAGESINTIARTISLARKGQYGKAATIWLANGAILSLMSALVNWMTDDDKKRQQRSAASYFLTALAGPVSGIPILSGTIGYAIEESAKAAGIKGVYASQSNLMVPFSDLKDSYKAAKDIGKIFDPALPWQDRVLGINGAMKNLAVIFGALIPQDSKGKAATAGLLYSAAAAGNLLEFTLKTEKNAQYLIAPETKPKK